MINYELLEQALNIQAKKIIYLIKQDYYDSMSNSKKKVLDSLLESETIVIVNQGISKFKDKTLAHGGRTLRDGKIHFYPDVGEFISDEDMKQKCSRLLPHEIFHYFIQPDDLRLETDIERKMASFYTEGLVEKEARKFCQRHKEIPFEKSNYGYNINFVNSIQSLLGASNYDVIFSENDYIKGIGKYVNVYRECLERKDKELREINEIVKGFPENLRIKFFYRARTVALQNGNIDEVKEKLKSINYITQKNLEKQEGKGEKE